MFFRTLCQTVGGFTLPSAEPKIQEFNLIAKYKENSTYIKQHKIDFRYALSSVFFRLAPTHFLSGYTITVCEHKCAYYCQSQFVS